MPRAREAAQWLMQQPIFQALSVDEKNEAGSFVFLWGIFEARVISYQYPGKSDISINKKVCVDYANARHSFVPDLREEKIYFRNLFFDESGNPTQVWNDASFQGSDYKEEIQSQLLDPRYDARKDMEILMRIVTRLRNNLFHGIKWASGMEGQMKNFVYGNSVMIKLMP